MSASAPPVSRRRESFRSEEHTSELQSLRHLVCRLLLEKKKNHTSSRPHRTFSFEHTNLGTSPKSHILLHTTNTPLCNLSLALLFSVSPKPLAPRFRRLR